MPEKRIQFNNIVQNQLPAYTQNEFPLVSEFLKQYYLGQEFQGGPIDLIQNIDQYVKVSEQTNQIHAVGLSTHVDQFTDVIPVDMTEYPAGTEGFPSSYGLLKIDNEIITYTGTASTCFTGCVRGFCGITSYKSETKPDVLVFDTSTSETHLGGSKIENLSTLFLKEFLLKTKHQLLPGFEDRTLHKDLDQNIFIKQAKDFYLSKGTDKSFEILFKALYDEKVEIVRPRDFLFTPSNANYRVVNQYVVENIEGEGNPVNLENATLFQDAYKNDYTKAYAPITSIEPINTGAGTTYYKLSLDGGYDRDSRVDGAIYGTFKPHYKTRVIGQVSSGSTSLDVDSTVGFPTSGELYCTYSDGTAGIVSYTSRNVSQFFGCSNINGTINNATNVGINTYVYGTSSLDSSKTIKVRIGKVLDKLEFPENTKSFGKGDIARIKTLGVKDNTFKGKDWFFNIASSYKINNVELIDVADYTYKVNLDVDHYLKVGDTVTVLQGGFALQTSTVLNINSAKSFNIKGQGQITDVSALTLRRNISKAVSNTYPTVTPYSTNVQNVYRRNGNEYLVAASSIPSYYAQPLNVNNQAVVFSGRFEGSDLQIKLNGDHGFYTGDAVYYSPERISQNFYDAFGRKVTEIVDGTELFDEGLYFVKRVNASTIRLATSRTNISNGTYVSIDTATTVTNSRIEPYDFRKKTLQSQNLLREFVDSVNDSEEPVETLPGFTGMLVNGVQVCNYKSSDSILYGQLNSVEVTSPGRDYDVINPPILHISDSVGSGATGYAGVSGSLLALKIIDPGFDYEETPTVTVSGGNGQGAVVAVNMKKISHQVDFFADAASERIGIGTTVNNAFQIGFSTYHKFRNAEKVVYYTYDQTQVGGLTTNAQYYVNTNVGVNTITLHKNEGDAIVGINTITLTSNGIGKQSFASVNKKSVVSSFNIISSGSGYQNKQTTTPSSGINTSTDIITISDHGYNSGEILKYTAEGTAAGGLTSGSEYYLTKIDDDSFKLSTVGVNTNDKSLNYRTEQFVDLTTIGVGTHSFNYQPITVSVKGKVGIASTAGNTFECVTQPIFRGEINSIHLSDNGVGYGSSEIINFDRQPLFKLIAGSQAQLTPVINDGKIVEVLVQNVGKEYNSPPDLVLIGDGIGAVLTPVLENNTITSVNVIEGGAGYTQSNTTITVVVPGDGAQFEANIKNWRINLFQRHYENFTGDDGFIPDEFNENRGLQYSHLYAPRKLREALYGTVGAGSTVSKTLYGKRDLIRVNSLEIASTDHSPILGWAYDGNPIYGPYGYSQRAGGVVRQLTSGYRLNLTTGRPPVNLFPEGFFVEDYTYYRVTDETVLDENNGRFCVTPEFPNGTYAYFTTITDGVADGTGPFAGYKRPTFPYIIGENYHSTPNDFNFQSTSNQEQYLLEDTTWARNTIAYNLIEGKDHYEYVHIPNDLKQTIEISAVSPGQIKKIGIQTTGTQYQVGDKVVFNNDNTEGSLASAVVSKVVGKDVTNVSVATSSITSVKVYPGKQKGEYILYSDKPNQWSDGDLINVSGLSTTSSGIGGVYKAGITTNTLSLIGFGTQPTGIGSDGVTGITTYFNVDGDYNSIDPNDILRIGTEKIKVLQVEPENNRIRALRAVEGTTGAAHTVTTVLYEDPRKIRIQAGFNTTYTVKTDTELYFRPTVTASIGSTVITPAGLAIGDTATATATLGAGTSEGQVISIEVTDGGSEYASVPTVTFSAPAGSEPSITVGLHTVGTGNTTSINPASVSIASSGIGYATAPTITISDSFLSSGGIQTAVGIATISTAGFVTAVSFNVADPWAVGTAATIGLGYSTAPTLSFSAPTELTTAEATAVLTADVVTSLTLTNAGAGYTSAPTITIVDPDAAPVYETGVGLGATIQLSDNPNYPNKRSVGTPVGGYPRGRGSAGAGLTDIKIPYKTIFLPNHGFETGDIVDYYPNLGSGLVVQDDVVTEPTSGNFVGNTTSILQSGDRLFIAKVSNNLIGIATVRVGLDSSGNNWVGVAESVRTSSTLAIIGVGTGVEHSFKTVYDPITCEIQRNLVTVSTGSSHGLLKDDEVNMSVSPGSITTSFTVKYNDYNRRIVINPKDFTAAGVNTSTNEITINNHQLVTGQQIIHTASTPSVGLSNDGLYYVMRVDDNTFKLADTYYNATLLKPIIVGITSASAGTINPINPPLKVYKNQSAIFDLSDSSLGFVNQATTYSAFQFNFYIDKNLTERWDTDKVTENFNVTRVGKAGVDANASTTITVNENIPNILYYTLDTLEESDLPISKKSIIKRDTRIDSANELQSFDSGYNGIKKVAVGATNTFTYTVATKPEKASYISSTSVLSYETESTTAFGGVAAFEIKNLGSNYYSVPGITTITSDTGKGGLIDVVTDNIGQVRKTHLKDIGYDFPTDSTLRPSVGLPQIITIENLASIKSIGITSVGRGYTTAPKLLVFDGITNKRDLDIDLDYSLGDQQVSILKNTKGLSNVQPTIIPTNASNGVGINTVGFNTITKDVSVTMSVGFSTAGSFPFSVGDKVLIEGVSVGLATTARGYNSAEYDYKLFEITAVDPNIGGLGIVTYSLLNEYQDLDPDVTPGNYNSQNSVGRIIPEKYFPIFDVKLGIHDYIKGETVQSDSAIGEVEDWDSKLGQLRVSSTDEFKIEQKIRGLSSETLGIASSITTYESYLQTSVSTKVNEGWQTDSGVLNYSLQRVQDSYYYQNFSYSLRSKVAYDTWNDVVSALNHTLGHIKFSDMQIDTINSNSMIVGLTTETTSCDVVNDLYGIGDLNCVHDFDLVTENSKTVQGEIVSDEIIFSSRILTDFDESVGNRVLAIDDVSGSFNHRPRATQYSVANEFDLATTRARKSFHYIMDKRFTGERQLMVTNVIHDNSFGYLTQYGNGGNVYDLGSFDFAIVGGKGQLRFYPRNFKVNDFHMTTVSYNLEDEYLGIGTTSVGVALIESHSTTAAKSDASTVIVGIASTYRSAKVLVSINPDQSKTETGEFEYDELNIIHDGSTIDLVEYDQLVTLPGDYTSSGVGTYSVGYSGSDIQLSWHPDSGNAGVGTTAVINTITIGIGNSDYSGVGTFTMKHSKFNTKSTTIASASVGTTSVIGEYITQTDSATDGYDAGYFIVQLTDTTNGSYNMAEMLVMDDYLLAEESGNTLDLEYGNIGVSGIGTLGSRIVADTNAGIATVQLLCTPTSNIGIQAQVFMQALRIEDDSKQNIEFDNGAVTSEYSDYTGTERDIKKAFDLQHETTPIFNRSFEGDSSAIVSVDNDTITIPNHFFVTGEKVTYTHVGTGSSGAVGIAATNGFAGVGNTTLLPSDVFVVKINENTIKLSATAEKSLRSIPEVVDITTVGIGTSHRFTSQDQNAKVIVSLDNVIQSPVVSTAVTTTLAVAAKTTDDIVYFVGLTSFTGADIFKVGNEIMRIDSVGVGSTNAIRVRREWLGTTVAGHSTGALVTKVNGNYNIVENVLNFTEAPYGYTPLSSTTNPPDDRDWTGIATSSSFNGRVFMRSGETDTSNQTYYNNYIFDDISQDFNGVKASFDLKTSGSNVTGIATENAVILVNDVFQGPVANYDLNENAGVTSITFTGAGTSVAADVNTSQLPIGGVIVSVGSTEGMGYQPIVAAGGTVVVSTAGTISAITIGYSGSGYRSGIGQTVNVAIQTSSLTGINVTPFGTATIGNNGTITGIAVTNTHVIYKPRDIQNVGYNSATGITTITTANRHGLQNGEPISLSGIAFTCDYATAVSISTVGYTTSTGVMTVTTYSPHGLSTTGSRKDAIFTGLAFTCALDGGVYQHIYPRNKDRVFNTSIPITKDGTAMTVTNAVYDPTVGIMTVTSASHGLSNGDKVRFVDNSVTFTCAKDGDASNHSYPRPGDPLSSSWTTVSNVTTNTFRVQALEVQPSTNTSAHTFVSATADGLIKQDNKITINVTAAKALDQYAHTFVGPGTEAVIVGGDYGHKFIGIAQSAVVSGGAYDHTFVSATTGGVTIVGIGTTTPSDVTYDADTGEMVMTIDGVGSGTTVGLGVSFATNAISFTCSMDGFASTHSYPRATDPVVGFGSTAITALTGNTVTVNVGTSKTVPHDVSNADYTPSTGELALTFVNNHNLTGSSNHTISTAVYDPVVGIMTVTVAGATGTGTTSFANGDRIKFVDNSLTFTCAQDNHGTEHTYPRASDPKSNKWLSISGVTTNTFEVQVLDSLPSTNTGVHTFVRAGIDSLTKAGDSIRFTPNSLAFTCDMDQHGSVHTYPRPSDPMYNTAVSCGTTTANTVTVNVGVSSQVNFNVTAADYDAATGIMTMTIGAHNLTIGDNIKLKKESLTFTCTKDGNATRHKYPREGDPTYNGTAVTKVNSTTEFEVNIGISTVLSNYTGVGTAKVQPCIIAPRAVNQSTSKTDPAEPGVNVLSVIDDYSFIVDTGVSTLPHNYARGGTVSKPMEVVIDEPLSYTNIPLDYATPAVGVGTNATVDIVVSLGGSVRDFVINNSGNGYGNTEVLRVPFGGDTGIPTTSSFTNNPFELTIDEIYSDDFTGWSIGTLEALDDWDSKFDGNTTVFQLQRAGDTISIRSAKGSNINVRDVILVFINDILQVPDVGYKFEGGSNVTFTEAPKIGDTSKILFYKGSGGIDVKSKEIIETVKTGDNLTIERGSEPFYLGENVRGVSTVTSTDTVNTVPYYGPGNTENESLLRPVVWCRQTEDRIINEEMIGKDRELYNANVNPIAYGLNSVGIGSTMIFVSNIRPFFDPTNENANATLRGTIQDKIDILPQLTRTGAAGTALVSTAGTVTGVTISDGGVGYSTATVSFASTTGVSTSTQAMGSLTIGAAGTITGVAITNPGVGYTQTSVPLVSFSPPTLISETDSVRSYEGDSGTIVGFGTTTISSSSQLIFDLFIPLDSYLRDTTLTGTAVTICGLTTGAMFMVSDSNVGVGSTRVTSLNSGDETIGIGHSYVDNVYEVADCEGQYINVTGVGFTFIKRVFAKISGQVSGSYSGITSSNYQGSFSWGKIIVSRSEENAYTAYTQSGIGTNDLTGISTSFIIRRTNALKSKSYT